MLRAGLLAGGALFLPRWAQAEGGGFGSALASFPSPFLRPFATELPLPPVPLSNLLALLDLTLTGLSAGWLASLLCPPERPGRTVLLPMLAAGALLEASSWAAFVLHVGVGELRQIWWLPLSLGWLHQLSLERELRRIGRAVFGPDSMVPTMQDWHDFVAHNKWFFGKGPKPQFDRWTYWEKFDYFAVFWGIAIMLYEATLVSDESPMDQYLASRTFTQLPDGTLESTGNEALLDPVIKRFSQEGIVMDRATILRGLRLFELPVAFLADVVVNRHCLTSVGSWAEQFQLAKASV